MLKVKNMISPRTQREVANQFIIEDEERIVFQSYKSTIAVILKPDEDFEKEVLVLGKNWDYSKTTMKYLNQFLYEYYNWDTNAKEIRKAIANDEIAYNPNLL